MLDFNKTALVLMDLQKGILELPTAPHTTDTVISNASKLVELFRKENGFIAFVRVKFHDGKDKLAPNAMRELPAKNPSPEFADFAEELQVSQQDFIVNKRGFSAFFGTDLDLQLRRRGIDTVVVGGISTQAAVDSTARDAYQLGYDQYFITDMMAAQTEELHQFPIKHIFPIMGQTMTTEEFLDKIVRK